MQRQRGFTLIELSIVLVIIGLIIGGILTGQNLIDAAAQRAQIAQIEKYNTAVRTFQGKYGYLPGDIPNPQAAQFGFQTRGTLAAQGDGNGVIEANQGNNTTQYQGVGLQGLGEIGMFWVDLSTAGLIDASFSSASSIATPGQIITGNALNSYMPTAKIGNNNYVYVWSGGTSGTWMVSNGINYFGLSGMAQILANGFINSSLNLTVLQAYNMDKKVDDGNPLGGNIQAIYDYGSGSTHLASHAPAANPDTTATCYNMTLRAYSIGINAGGGMNCAISFSFQ